MQVTFWGVRGSIPVPGSPTTAWGGNSSCVEVRDGDLPPVVLDCGTGARNLGFKLVREPGRRLELMFSHYHMDHIFGFPFFLPVYTPGYEVVVTGAGFTETEIEQKLSGYLNGTYHPTRTRDLLCALSFRAVRPGATFDASGWTVTTARMNHPGSAIGYRLDRPGASFAYVTDTAPFARLGDGVAAGLPSPTTEARVLEFLHGCHTVAFDTMFDLDEYMEKMTWGHAYPEYAIALCQAAGVKHLILFHHLPDASDAQLDARAARYAEVAGLRVTLAREGETVDVG